MTSRAVCFQWRSVISRLRAPTRTRAAQKTEKRLLETKTIGGIMRKNTLVYILAGIVCVAACGCFLGGKQRPVPVQTTESIDAPAATVWSVLLEVFGEQGWNVEDANEYAGTISTAWMAIDDNSPYMTCAGAFLAVVNRSEFQVVVAAKQLGERTQIEVTPTFRQERTADGKTDTFYCESTGSIEGLVRDQVARRATSAANRERQEREAREKAEREEQAAREAEAARRAEQVKKARGACYRLPQKEVYAELYAVLSANYTIDRESERRGYVETGWTEGETRSRVVAEIMGESCLRVVFRVEGDAGGDFGAVEDDLYVTMHERLGSRAPAPSSPTAPVKKTGSEGGACYGNGTCDEGLTCASDLCVKLPSE